MYSRNRAFTLVELLVVMLIVGVLIALLVPGVATAWQVASSTKCKHHLATIWKATGEWRADNDNRMFGGAGWMARLIPYLDGDNTYFHCDARLAQIPTASSMVAAVDENGDPFVWDPSNPEQCQPPCRVDYSFEFDVYGQDRTGVPQKEHSTAYGAFKWNIPLAGHPWVMRYDEGSSVRYKIDDQGATGSYNGPTWDDMEMVVHYKGDQPVKLEVVMNQHIWVGYNSPTGSGSSMWSGFIVDFKVNGKVFIKDWVQTLVDNGCTTVDASFTKDLAGAPSGNEGGGSSGGEPSGGGTGSGSGSSGQTVTNTNWLIILGDYGISRGCFEVYDHDVLALPRAVPQVDARLFFVLDYPVPLADFNGVPADDIWEENFIQDPEEWKKNTKLGRQGLDWRAYQVLRHFGQANVLFCDGHIESLGPEDLQKTDTRWKYIGR